MRRRVLVRVVATLSRIAALVLVTAACGGGGSQGADDLYLQKFLLVDQNLKNIGGTGATNAYRDTRVLFVFNTAVDPATVSDRTIRIGIPTENNLFLDAPGRFEVVDGHPNWVLFDPTISRNNQTDVHDNPFGLDGNAHYEVHIPSVLDAPKVVMSAAGKGIVLSYAASFDTGNDYIQDYQQPVLLSTEPEDNALDVSPTADILLHFSEPMRPDTFKLGETVFVRDLTNDIDVLGQIRFSADAKTVTFRPVFGYGKGPNQIFVRVTTDVANLPGNPIPKEIRLQFTTAHDSSQPDFEDITESFDDNVHEDTGFTASYPLANWNVGVTSGFLAGALTTGTITHKNDNGTILWPPWCWGNNFASQFQVMYLSTEIGSGRTITGFDWYYYSTSGASTVTNVTINMGHTKLGGLTTNLASNFSDTPVTVVGNVGTYSIPSTPTQGWLAAPNFTQSFRYNGTDNLLIEIFNTCGPNGYSTYYSGLWYIKNPDTINRVAYTRIPGSGTSPTVQPYDPDIRFNYLIDTSEAQSLWYDTNLQNPEFLDAVIFPSISSQPGGSSTTLEFQGGLTNPDAPSTPDLTKLSQWTDDLTKLSGYRFIRFHFLLKANQTTGQVPVYDEVVLPFIFF
jgi:hypothetical protein